MGIVDERSEIAGCFRGIPQLEIGLRTDVLDACPKAEGIMLMLRSLSPQVIITDEIGRREDALAVEEAVHAVSRSSPPPMVPCWKMLCKGRYYGNYLRKIILNGLFSQQ